MLKEAFTHPSYKVHDSSVKSYEQLETLGDSVIDLLITKKLIYEDQEISSGELTKQRSRIVNNVTLNQLGLELDLDLFIRTSDNYKLSEKDLANTVEALFGAIYLNSGISACGAFLNQIWFDLLRLSEENEILFYARYPNPIGYLQEFLQSNNLELPEYEMIDKEGPDHSPKFKVKIIIKIGEKKLQDIGHGSSKQKARVAAAAIMLNRLHEMNIIS